ncbi:MAG: pseudouridine synthase [Bryobacteraceae bacterium]|nr:pseudouridine synthase [Bryobacteraceae bacterium]
MCGHRYVLFHKPFGVLCQFTDDSPHPRPTLKDFIAINDVYPAGRLDFDSEGLLLLTSDGAFQHRLSDPRFGHPRTYWVQVEGSPSDSDLEPLRRGLIIQHRRTLPASARILGNEPELPPRATPIRYRRSIPVSWIELTLTEGKNRQVRRMTAAVGFPTLRLVRVAIGPVRIDGLAPGQWRDLTAAELRALGAVSAKASPPAAARR